MSEWKESIIENTSIQMIDGDRGKNYPKNSDFFSQGYCLFLNAGNVTKKGFSFSDNVFITKEKDSLLRNGRVEINDVIITTRGTVGNVALYDSSIPYKHMRINSGMLILKSGCDMLPEYLYYYLRSNSFQTQILQFVSGSAQPQLPKSTLGKMIIMFPKDTKIQKKICSILKSLDDKIEINRRINDNFYYQRFLKIVMIWMITSIINDNLEQQAQAIFKSWFVDFEPFKNGEFIDSELGRIPKGWTIKELGQVTISQNEKVKKRQNVKVFSPVTSGELVLSEEYFTKRVYSENVEKYILVRPNEFAYNPARVNIGSIGMNTYGFDGCVSPVYVVFKCEEGYQFFFDMFRQTSFFKEEVKTRAIGGVRQTLGYKDFAMIKIVYPPKDIIEAFNDIYTKLLLKKYKNSEENKHLASVQDIILPKLMSGELKVSEINM